MSNLNFSGGYAGKILRVDLSKGEVSTEDTEKYAQEWIGGRAINSKIMFDEIEPGTKWSDPENLLLFGMGPLVGTMAPAASRVSIDTINVFNNGKGSGNLGGHFGPMVKYAGFDNIVIKGKADSPVYLWIEDGEAEIRDAEYLWGKTNNEIERALREELGDENIEIASIGPAGENRVKAANVVVDCGRSAGGAGVGCVMGDKKLKAIVVRGHGSLKAADPERFMEEVDKADKKIRMANEKGGWTNGIINAAYLPHFEISWNYYTTAKNKQVGYWPHEKREKLCGIESGVQNYEERGWGCFNCPVPCTPFSRIERDGTKGVGYWINSVQWSQMLDVVDPELSLKAHLKCNDLGLDGDNSTVTMSWAYEAYEKGVLSKEDTDGLELKWGDGEVALELYDKIAYREGFGDFLADGVKEAAEKLGKGSEEFAMHIKNQPNLDDSRISKGWGLGVTTSPIGGRHLRGAIGPDICTGPQGVSFDSTKYEKMPEMVYWQIRAKEVNDMLGICNYMTHYFGVYALSNSDLIELANPLLGLKLSEEEYMSIGRRAYNLEKAFTAMQTDFDRKDDLPPKRQMETPIGAGPYKGEISSKDKWNDMLDKFYALQDWDKETGKQTRSGLEKIGLKEVADKLAKAGKLIEK